MLDLLEDVAAASGLLPAGLSQLDGVWKMCQVRGFCAPTLPLSLSLFLIHTNFLPFTCFGDFDHSDEMPAEVSFFHIWAKLLLNSCVF